MSTTVGTPRGKSKPESLADRSAEPDRSAGSAQDVVPVAAIHSDRLNRLSVGQNNLKAESGILGEETRIELIEGLLVHKVTRNDRLIKKLIVRALERTLPEGWHIGEIDPVQTARGEPAPEPDVAVLGGPIEDDVGRKPTPADCALVVEVPDSCHPDDQVKRAILAEAGIPLDWIANLHDARIEAHAELTAPNASTEDRSRRDDPVGEEIPLVFDGREVT